jgi:uncharacterized RDD family membrane protein YckC
VWDADYQPEPGPETEPEKTVIGGEAFAVGFEMLESRDPENPAAPGWRQELKRRLEEHSSKTKDGATDDATAKSTETPAEKESEAATSPGSTPEEPAAKRPEPAKSGEKPAPKIFDYRLKKPVQPRSPLPNPVRQKDSVRVPSRPKKGPSPDPVLNRQLVREEDAAPPPKSMQRDRPLSIPRQGKLNLEPEGSSGAEKEPAPRGKAQAKPVRRRPVSRDILFSRFLAGVVDLTLPLALGVAFSLAAAWSIGSDFFSPDSIRFGVLLSLGFYLFNSSFFLLLAGQTPGMYVAQLALVSEQGSRDIPVASTILRVLLFIPSALSVIGLIWGTFDSGCRCLHDILSGTRIAPLADALEEV